MYSSLLGGIVTDPELMLIPADDHLAHRGDGVFDTFKCVKGAIYNFEAHLIRTITSGKAIGINWPDGIDGIRKLVLATLRATGRADSYGRVILSRGPGGFGVNPYESPAPALYILVYELAKPFMELKPEGARVKKSTIPQKPSIFATVKSCNYLANAMMKREAVDAGVDFVVGFDAKGFMTEGATENAGIITEDGELAFPRLENILAGTTMLRVAGFARQLVAKGELRSVSFRDISEQEVLAAAEMFFTGTTLNVAPVVEYEGRAIGTGRPGPVALKLNEFIVRDVLYNDDLRTPW
jgi:branched-chain amino acid aminotransferase